MIAILASVLILIHKKSVLYETVLKLIQNTEQNDKQNRNEASYLEIFQYLKHIWHFKTPIR